MIDWRNCEHEWQPARTGKNYRFYCKKCAVFSYIGPTYDLIDKTKSVFLTGRLPLEPPPSISPR
jgi:hypothetical protein